MNNLERLEPNEKMLEIINEYLKKRELMTEEEVRVFVQMFGLFNNPMMIIKE